MAKVSKRRTRLGLGRKGSQKSKNRSRSKTKRRSRTMKNAKRGISMKKMMGGSQKARKVYCVSCKKKVSVVDYEIKSTPRGAYQLIGQCGNKNHKVDKNGNKKVYSFVGAKDV